MSLPKIQLTIFWFGRKSKRHGSQFWWSPGLFIWIDLGPIVIQFRDSHNEKRFRFENENPIGRRLP